MKVDIDKTMLFNIDDIKSKNVQDVLEKICSDLNERGYDSIKQITGYLISGDSGYISSYKNCRERIVGLDRTLIVEYLLKNYVRI